MVIKQEENHRAVFFIEDHQVTRQMLYSEFEAILDGYAGIPSYADQDIKAVYVVLDSQLRIHSLVFFLIYFDDSGLADTSWNIPLVKLAAISGRGPDLGGGQIRLACRGQCPINWHQKELWDPDMDPGSNDFLAIKRGVQENRLYFQSKSIDGSATLNAAQRPLLTDNEPVLDDDDANIPLLEPETSIGRRAGDPEKRNKLARLIKDQRLRIRTLASNREQKLKKLAREHRIEVQSYKSKFETLKQNIEQYRVINDQLKKKLFQRNEQLLELQDQLVEKTAQYAVLERRVEQTAQGNRLGESVDKLEAELSLLRDKLEKQEIDLSCRDEREDQLKSELAEIKKHSQGGEEAGILSRLKQLDVVFVAYHPGAGHVTIPFSDIKKYSQNSRAYVAAKCFVTEDQYSQWLMHYETSVCRHYSDKGEICGRPVSTVAVPSEFEAGVSDRCPLHSRNLF